MDTSRKRSLPILVFLLLLITAQGICRAEATSTPVSQSLGQVIYVPIYSHIYIGNKESPFNLAATISIRNTDPKRSITLVRVEYYGSSGKLLKKYLEAPISLGPMAATHYVVKEADTTGGSGASFLATWQADKPVTPPLLESVMIGTQLQQGLSFTSRGQVLSEISP